MAILTARAIEALKPGGTLSDEAPRGAGVLQVRCLKSGGLSWYYRYTEPSGQRVRLTLGNGLSLAQARAEVEALKRRYAQGDKALREALQADAVAKHAEAERQKRETEALAARGTLGTLLELYADHLQAQGKSSATRVRSSLRLHVRDTNPTLWDKPAADVAPEDGVTLVSDLLTTGKMRESAKLRSYLRAAFALAVRSHTDARASTKLRALGIRSNPFAELATVDAGPGTRERALSVSELRAYWQALATVPAPYGALLRLHLMSGGQRVEQLSRAMLADFDREAETLTLLDSKGRRKQPRRHVVPLLPDAMQAIEELHPRALGPHLFSATSGAKPAQYHILQVALRKVADDLHRAGLVESPFTIGDLRRTVETRLAAAGVSSDVRAQVQSHGLGGVQARHYDRHDYMHEKRAALETLRAIIIAAPATVTAIGPRKAITR
ncbi:MAG: integrase family protein [Xanthomonadales bacterium]|nr:integrase family protein [Xanthomonadales bacterium]